ncbi:MAG: neutral/alkaline non-lysosomal ceramidase N-terminal domain-containing protein [Candidatus Aminicenantes bacterium]|nr:neutral/alkaline non-lysosomal ceramidase N-terminal domain-containing protein [Candidatus Aminicenantes bacterium]
MTNLKTIGFGICLLGLTASPWVLGSNLKAGVAKVDITPAPGKYMLGSGTTLATGAHDPLYARVLVLEVDQTRMALITVDLCRVFQAPLMDRLRRQVKESSGISFVLMVATHTHSAPMIPINENHPLTGMVAWQEDAVAKIARATEKAYGQAAEAWLGTGYGVAYIGHNRRKLNPDGTVTMMFRNPTKIPTAPFDPTVAVLRIDTGNRKPLAVLVNYACHPVVVMANLKQYSADFPGVMCETVEQAFGPQTMAFFLNGGAGDIDTYYTGVPIEEDPVARMVWSGETLGKEAVRVARKIRTEPSSEASLDFSEDWLTFGFRWDVEKYMKAFEESVEPELRQYYLPEIKPEKQVPVTTVLVNKQIAFMGMPGEPFIEFQMNWRERSPVADSFFLGYANGFFSYFPTIRAATEGGHGAKNIWARIEPGAGERIVDHCIIRIYEMLGRLTDDPAVPAPAKDDEE